MDKNSKIIFGNYGNETIALIQWASQQSLTNVYVVNVNTGFSASWWHEQIKRGQQLAKQLGFQVVELQARPDFVALVTERANFPSVKFQWCAGILKGLPLLHWLDEQDPGCESIILLGKYRAASRRNFKMQPVLEQSEHFGDRRVEFPLIDSNEQQIQQWVQQAGFQYLPHRSLECDPCIHSTKADFQRFDEALIERVQTLENTLGQTMFAKSIVDMVNEYRQLPADKNTHYHEKLSMGCGDPFGCGL